MKNAISVHGVIAEVTDFYASQRGGRKFASRAASSFFFCLNGLVPFDTTNRRLRRQFSTRTETLAGKLWKLALAERVMCGALMLGACVTKHIVSLFGFYPPWFGYNVVPLSQRTPIRSRQRWRFFKKKKITNISR